MSLILDRRVRRLASNGHLGPPEPLSAYRDTSAYVLLGDPGAGKTRAFRREASDPRGSTPFHDARDFLTLELSDEPPGTFFLDGLDEIRAGTADPRGPLDKIRRRLDRLGRPRFRISCREADWLGSNDWTRLQTVSPDGKVVVLRLDPLDDGDIHALAASVVGDGNIEEFQRQAQDRGLRALLENPQNLVLLAKVFADEKELPASRPEAFDRATALLAHEPNEEHRLGGAKLPVPELLDAAGRISAVSLLSEAETHCRSEAEAGPGWVPPSAYGEERRAAVAAALRTRLFTADPQRRGYRPAHANLAAFLAAKTLAGLVRNGLPKGRVLSLIAGHDGAPPSSLRSLAAWLAAFSPEIREELIERDAVGVLLYGDVQGFGPSEKRRILDCIGGDPARLPENIWRPAAVAALATADMEPVLREILENPDRSDAQQHIAAVVLEALSARPLPALADLLPGIVLDSTRFPRARGAALDAWIRSLREAPDRVGRLRDLLERVHADATADSQGELVAMLLKTLYPGSLSPEEVWDFFPSGSADLHWRAAQFWQELSRKCPEGHLAPHLAALTRRPGGVDPALAAARRRLGGHPNLVRFLDSQLKRDLPEEEPPTEFVHASPPGDLPEAGLLEATRASKHDLRENRAPAALLYRIVRHHIAGSRDPAEGDGPTRLFKALGGDERLAEAAWTGVRRAPFRDDLPSAEKVLQLRVERRMSCLTEPVLVGLSESASADAARLEGERLRTALAFRLVVPTSAYDGPWYLACVREQPELVADVLVLFARRLLQEGDDALGDFWRLAYDQEHTEVARQATLPLLRAFPVRAKARQHGLLVQLLHSALTHCAGTPLRDLIEEKLARRSMTKGQGLYWLGAGLTLDPPRFGKELARRGDDHIRQRMLSQLYPARSSLPPVPGFVETLSLEAIEWLIRLLGPGHEPVGAEETVFVSRNSTSLAVEELIGRLAESPDPEAGYALRRLTQEDALTVWHRHLAQAIADQARVQRDADYAPPTAAQVIEALADGPPASASDLRELVLDRLTRIQSELRTTNANLWRQFWNENTEQPKHENSCRDALLALLRNRLPDGCDAQPEGQYAAERRADIRVSHGAWNIPVEIKKNTHRDLWSAAQNQLLPRYANDPATEGLGVLLVLWFGGAGTKQASPAELQKSLLEELSTEERHRAAVLVMDVTAP